MRISKTHKAAAVAVLLAAAGLTAAAAPAQAETLVPGVTGCGASGVKQERGALIGAIAGGLLGNSVSGHNRTTGTVVGAAAGAAAGSAIGCQMQHNDEQRAAYGDGRYGAATYRHDGYELANGVAPASYQQMGGGFFATKAVNLRAAPDAGSPRVGKLRRGEHFQALAQVRGSDWILVGRGGVGVGYVHGAFTRPEGERYADRY